MSCPRFGCQLLVATVVLSTSLTYSVATDSEQSQEILTLQQLPDNKDPASPLENLPDIQDLGLPASVPSLPSAAAIRFPFLGASHGFLRSPPDTDEANLEEQASILQQELNRIRQQLTHESKLASSLSDSRKDVHFHLAPTQMALRENGTSAENQPVADSISDASDAAADHHAQASVEVVTQASFYSQIGAIVALVLQLALIIAILAFIHYCGIGISDFGAPIFLGILFFIVSDIVWVYITLTGALDDYIKQVLFCVVAAVLIFGHIAVVFYIVHVWALKKLSTNSSFLSAKRAAQSIVNVEHKLDALCSHMLVDVTGGLLNDAEHDSENEDGDKPASKSDNPPPDVSAEKFPIMVTFLNASVHDADRRQRNPITSLFGAHDDVSDPYCSCAVRGREDACPPFQTPVIQDSLNPTWKTQNRCVIKDFRHGDTLKLKVWDSNMLSPGLLGKLDLKFEEVKEVTDAAKDGHTKTFDLVVPPKLKEEHAKHVEDGKAQKLEQAKLTIKIDHLDLTIKAKVKTRSAFACC